MTRVQTERRPPAPHFGLGFGVWGLGVLVDGLRVWEGERSGGAPTEVFEDVRVGFRIWCHGFRVDQNVQNMRVGFGGWSHGFGVVS